MQDNTAHQAQEDETMSRHAYQLPQEPQAVAKGQALFLVCSSDLRTVRALADEVEDRLAAQGIPARILLYGVGAKRRDGFLLAQSAKAMPPAFIQWLSSDEDILDYVVYNGAFCKQAHQERVQHLKGQEGEIAP